MGGSRCFPGDAELPLVLSLAAQVVQRGASRLSKRRDARGPAASAGQRGASRWKQYCRVRSGHWVAFGSSTGPWGPTHCFQVNASLLATAQRRGSAFARRCRDAGGRPFGSPTRCFQVLALLRSVGSSAALVLPTRSFQLEAALLVAARRRAPEPSGCAHGCLFDAAHHDPDGRQLKRWPDS